MVAEKSTPAVINVNTYKRRKDFRNDNLYMEYVHNNVRLGQTVKGLDTRGVVRKVDGYQLTCGLTEWGTDTCPL